MATEAEDITDPSSSDDATVSIADMKWDPLASPDWELHKHTSEAIIRIKRDLYTIFNDPPPGVFIVPHKDDITRIHILMNGPFDTPYEGGYFYFILRFPPDYPYSPPRVKFMTTAGGTVRFNPNLYADGKVCLSVLG
jgi:ubiquitin-conjugating enzyme E2 Z